MLRPSDVRATWERESGWAIHSPTALARPQLLRIAQWIKKQQIARYQGLPPGDRKDECALTIEHADVGKIRCVLTGPEATIFASTERTRPDRSFHIVGDKT